MKKLVYLIAILAGFSASAAPAPHEVGEKVLQAFRETFAGAQDVTWNEYEDYCQVNFHQDDIQVRAQYDENGKLLKTIRYYSEKELLPNITARLKQKYSGTRIEGVTETTSDSEVTFVINLKDATHWYVVKSDPYGALHLVQKFRRADQG